MTSAETKGRSRSNSPPAAPPEDGERLFDHVVATARSRCADVQTGRFGAHMQVALVNDGPVTFTLRVGGR